jgi:hypothetical protein
MEAPNAALALGRPALPSAGEAHPRYCDTMSLVEVVPLAVGEGTTRTTGEPTGLNKERP